MDRLHVQINYSDCHVVVDVFELDLGLLRTPIRKGMHFVEQLGDRIGKMGWKLRVLLLHAALHLHIEAHLGSFLWSCIENNLEGLSRQ